MKKNIIQLLSIFMIVALSIYIYQLRSELNSNQTKLQIVNKDYKEVRLKYSTLLLDQVKTNDNIKEIEQYNNVGNSQTYKYKVTSINNNEINGISINKQTDDNKGITLYKNEVNFDVKVGDKIAVIWGNEEDQFKSITKINH